MRLLLVILLALSGCNVVHFNHWMLRKRFSRAGIAEHYADLPSGRMRYYEGGQGPPLVLVHGFGYGTVENWSAQVAVLSRHHHVILPDMYWFGASYPKVKIETAADETEALIELLDALKVDRADFIGSSFGGLMELQLALKHRDRVDRLVLMDAVGIRPTREEELRIQANFGGHHTIAEFLMPTKLEDLKRFLERVVYRHKPPFPDWILRQVMAELGRNREARLRLSTSMQDEIYEPEALHKIEARTLVLWGRRDPLLLVSMGERMARAIPGAQLEVIENGAHSIMLEEPRRVNEAVIRFLDGPSSPRSAGTSTAARP
jgi:pimeloyl-ACP methyl ester carboxylesterase